MQSRHRRIDGNYLRHGSPRNSWAKQHSRWRAYGTNAPHLMDGLVSYGSIRSFNQDLVDLYGRVSSGDRDG